VSGGCVEVTSFATHWASPGSPPTDLQSDRSNTGKTSPKYPVNYHNRLCMQMQHTSGAALIWRDMHSSKGALVTVFISTAP